MTRLLQLIRDTKDLTFAEKGLLHDLANYGNAHGGGIYPGLALLAENGNGATERTVRRLIKRLISKGYLKEDGLIKHRKQYCIPIYEKWTPAQIAPNKGKPKKTPLELVPPQPQAPEEEESTIPPWRIDMTEEERAERQRLIHMEQEEEMKLAKAPPRQRTYQDEERLRKAGFLI